MGSKDIDEGEKLLRAFDNRLEDIPNSKNHSF